MIIDNNNPIATKSKAFALRIIKLYQFLSDEKKEYVLSKQVLRSGTSIGANVREGLRGQSKADFGAKMNIALKEANETEYWLELLYESSYIEEKPYASITSDLNEILSLLTSIVRTVFSKNDSK